eukprot:gene19914-26618_t
MTGPRILVAGSPGCGKRSLVRAVVATDKQPDDTSTAPGHDGDRIFPWTIDTKYYTAEVSFHVWSVGPSAPVSTDSSCEAVLLVFDATSQDSFLQVQSWFQR